MMIVDIDIGNTRAKWRLSSDGNSLHRGVIDTGGGDWSSLSMLSAYQPERVRVSNVAGEAVAQQVRRIAARDFGIKAEFALACESVGAVTSGYEDPQRLGVDRWLAILAGWELFRNRCVVVDAGSALTFDFIDANGGHLGGYIVPGQQMMINALFGGTSGVRVNSSQASGFDYGQNTDTAVRNGCFAMALALIEKVIVENSEERDSINIVLTGGDADLLLADLPKAVVHKPDLVLDGLVLALP
jgi:type III pantothenate kinase